MRQYEVTYNDKTTEIVEAYGYKFSHGTCPPSKAAAPASS